MVPSVLSPDREWLGRYCWSGMLEWYARWLCLCFSWDREASVRRDTRAPPPVWRTPTRPRGPLVETPWCQVLRRCVAAAPVARMPRRDLRAQAWCAISFRRVGNSGVPCFCSMRGYFSVFGCCRDLYFAVEPARRFHETVFWQARCLFSSKDLLGMIEGRTTQPKGAHSLAHLGSR